MKKIFFIVFFFVLLFFVLLLMIPNLGFSEVFRQRFQSGHRYLTLELLQDHLVHFEISTLTPGPDISFPIYTTPQVQRTSFAGPTAGSGGDTHLETARLKVDVDPSSLCFSVTDKTKTARLTTLCPLGFDGPSEQALRTLILSRESIQQVYGLGEQFTEPGSADGGWLGKVRIPGDNYGNAMVPFNGGFNGNAQFPVMYALGEGNLNYGLFLDHVYRQKWDLRGDPWRVETLGDTVRGYFIAGDDLPAIRTQFMDLVGRPLVPPRKTFGLWVSQYGFLNWGEIDNNLASLRRNGFPVDGFVLDLQWFGGVTPNSDNSRMGTLQFDERNFPNARQKIAQYRSQGVGIIPIEESYVSRGLPEFSLMQSRGYLAKDCPTCGATYITKNPWWGKGGMIDWTNPEAAAFWHDSKRQPLIDMGVVGHWTDLGEPEMYNEGAWYAGFPELGKFREIDVHNVFNLKWHESIYKGYQRNQVRSRPFLLGRSGAPGIQRYGAAMWSGDIGSNVANLATHLNAQMHLSFCGIDYFGADIGGFHRSALSGDLNEMFTQWFANGSSFDVPVRPHTENLCKCKETSPDRIGDVASNLANIRQRYELIPYYYSLAYRAYFYGEPVLPPMVYYYQNDSNVLEMGHQKLLGRSMMVGVVAKHGEYQRDIYLPAGDWIDYYTHRRFHSIGQWLRNVPEYRDGIFRLPVFAKAGALIPRMFVDDKTMDSFGHRTDGSVRNEFTIRAYSDYRPSAFTVFEDDGETVDYTRGSFRMTDISQNRVGNTLTVRVEGSKGFYAGAANERETVIEMVADSDIMEVRLNGTVLQEVSTLPNQGLQGFLPPAYAWTRDRGANLIRVHAGSMSVNQPKVFDFSLGRPSSARKPQKPRLQTASVKSAKAMQ